jgi:hypothetical protein
MTHRPPTPLRRDTYRQAPRWTPAPLLPTDWPPPYEDTEAYRDALLAPLEDYRRTFVESMTTRFGPGWDIRTDLTDEAYLAEVVNTGRASALHDHIDQVADCQARVAGAIDHLEQATAQLPDRP